MKRYMDVPEFAIELCVGTSVVYKLIRLHQIPVRKLWSGRKTYTFIDAPPER